MVNKAFLLGLTLFSLLLSSNVATATEEEAKNEIEKALSLSADPAKGKTVFETCSLCHTPEGWGSDFGRYPQIAGQHASVIIKQLADIRAGNRDNPTMLPFTQSAILKDAQTIADVAAYISTLPMTINNGKGPGFELQYGEKIYKKNCTKCHGEKGEGDADRFYPRIQGQHFQYLLRQMIWIQMGKRRNADKKMVKQIHSFGLRELNAVSDYVSRINPADDIIAAPNWKNPDFEKGRLSAPDIQKELIKKEILLMHQPKH